MKGLTAKSIYLNKYDVTVKPYLTYSQVQSIANAMKKFNSWGERETCKDMALLAFVTDIDKKELEEIGHDVLLKSGLIDAVRYSVANFEDVDRAIAYEESLVKSLQIMAGKLPEITTKIKELERKNESNSK